MTPALRVLFCCQHIRDVGSLQDQALFPANDFSLEPLDGVFLRLTGKHLPLENNSITFPTCWPFFFFSFCPHLAAHPITWCLVLLALTLHLLVSLLSVLLFAVADLVSS